MTDRRRFSEEETRVLAQAIVAAMKDHEENCRFRGINPQELNEAVLFVRNFNLAMADSRKTVRNTMIKLFLGAIAALVMLGAGVQIKKMIGPLP